MIKIQRDLLGDKSRTKVSDEEKGVDHLQRISSGVTSDQARPAGHSGNDSNAISEMTSL